MDLAVIRPAPEFELIEAGEGKPFLLSDLQGKAVLVGFVYTTCNGSCPATTHTMYRAQEELKAAGLWGDRVEFVSVTLDPRTDTSEVLDRYAKVFGADRSAWHFLTGKPDQVAKVIEAWDMWVRIGPAGTLDHPSRIFLLDPAGQQREIYNLDYLDPETLLRDVQEVLGERSEATH